MSRDIEQFHKDYPSQSKFSECNVIRGHNLPEKSIVAVDPMGGFLVHQGLLCKHCERKDQLCILSSSSMYDHVRVNHKFVDTVSLFDFSVSDRIQPPKKFRFKSCLAVLGTLFVSKI